MNNRKYAAFNGGNMMKNDEKREKLMMKILELVEILNDIEANGCDVRMRDQGVTLHFKCEFEIES